MRIKHWHLLFVILLIGWQATAQSAYREKYRPQLHFSPLKGWMNDPNGLVYYVGEYHLFYQYYPDSTVWGPMHWAHAVTRDLVHWEHLPIALYPDSIGYIFSGSAIIDWRNSSGFGTEGNPAMVAIFTYHDMLREKSGRIDCENQGIAYSLDKGRSWIKYSGNPVLLNPGIKDFRDPKVLWHEPSHQWKLVLSAHDRVRIYSSTDLKKWIFESDFGMNAGCHEGVWECPDLFPISIAGSKQTKWVLLVNINPGGPNGGSGTQYFVGNFDGHHFIPESRETSWLDWGRDNYAGVTWSDIPKEDGRRLFIGWLSNWNYAQSVPTHPWRSAMTLPRELKLMVQHGQYILTSLPVEELSNLRRAGSEIPLKTTVINHSTSIETGPVNLNQCELSLNFAYGTQPPDEFGLLFKNNTGEAFKISFSYKGKQLQLDRTQTGKMQFAKNFTGTDRAPWDAGRQVKLHLFIDAASIEIFVDDGKLVMSNLFFLSGNFQSLQLYSAGGDMILNSGSLWDLDSIWRKPSFLP